jgi:hypothetical protein
MRWYLAYSRSPLRDSFAARFVAFQLDLPELPALGGVDASDGPLRDAQRLAAEAFGARRTWFLVNGSSGGLHAAVLAAVQVREDWVGCLVVGFMGVARASPLANGVRALDVRASLSFFVCSCIWIVRFAVLASAGL